MSSSISISTSIISPSLSGGGGGGGGEPGGRGGGGGQSEGGGGLSGRGGWDGDQRAGMLGGGGAADTMEKQKLAEVAHTLSKCIPEWYLTLENMCNGIIRAASTDLGHRQSQMFLYPLGRSS